MVKREEANSLNPPHLIIIYFTSEPLYLWVIQIKDRRMRRRRTTFMKGSEDISPHI